MAVGTYSGFNEEQNKRLSDLFDTEVARLKKNDPKFKFRRSGSMNFTALSEASLRDKFIRQVQGESSTGTKTSEYESLLAQSNSLLGGASVSDPTQSVGLAGNRTDKKQVDTLLGAIRARQGEINTRKSLTQTRTSLLG